MTAEEALIVINEYTCKQNCELEEQQGCGECIEAYDILDRLCKNGTKYAWHDLRKNPNDLPELGKRVEVALADKETGENEDCYFTRYGMANPIGGKLMKLWVPPYQYCFYSSEIIAWREIEKFKEEE